MQRTCHLLYVDKEDREPVIESKGSEDDVPVKRTVAQIVKAIAEVHEGIEFHLVRDEADVDAILSKNENDIFHVLSASEDEQGSVNMDISGATIRETNDVRSIYGGLMTLLQVQP